MTPLACPFCGQRQLDEFRFRKTVAEAGSTAIDAVYQRMGNPSVSDEHWQHVQGCRMWLAVRRDPSTGQVMDVRPLQGRA